jgi:hypothetical protein
MRRFGVSEVGPRKFAQLSFVGLRDDKEEIVLE